MAAVPVMAVPVAVVPAPVTTMTPVVMVMPTPVVPVMPPPHFFRLDAVDLVARDHSGAGILIGGIPSALGKRLRQ
jgi:hypothetical protein